jgi:hypothetical protein
MVIHDQTSDAKLTNLKQKQMVPRRERRSDPYWNFWRVILAGWIIRYPGKFFRIIGVPLGFLLVLIYNAVTK